MCGICGIIVPDGASPEIAGAVRAMSSLIAHRGPDGEGFVDLPVGTLGHRRLAIIDVDGGVQPMSSDDGNTVVVFNGEIYNFIELRSELQSHGHEFRTRSDTEVLVHGWEQWGADVVDRLRGMFAFAIWDVKKHRLFFARDRLGIKPFYYHRDGDGAFAFASEIKALFAVPGLSCEVNDERLSEYLLFRYISGAATMFRGISELEPGTLGVLDAGGLKLRRYWRPEGSHREPDEAVALEEGRALLRDAVRSHLVSDVGLGTITSGGLDSSLVSALAADMKPDGIDTFCLGFDDPLLDERPYARDVAEAIGSRHHETVLDAEGFISDLERLSWLHDEPLSHPNAVAMHAVFRHAREHVGLPVLLSGEGADELFGGYGWYRAAWKRARLERLVGRAPARWALRHLLRGNARDLGNADYLLLANALGRAPELQRLPGVEAAVGARRDAYAHLVQDVEGMFRYDQLTYLQPLLQRQDRMSMAVGLEARVPFLDHPLVEWANGLGAAAKLGNGEPKRLLRLIAAGTLSERIIYRQKVGFALPLGEWLRGPLRERLDTVGDSASVSGRVLDTRMRRSLLDRVDRGDAQAIPLAWTLLALEEWHRAFRGTGVTSQAAA